MKKIIRLMSLLCLIVLAVGTLTAPFTTAFAENSTPQERTPLYIFNWGNYIDPDLIEKFESETNYTVIYETFDSNDAMEAKLKQGSTTYDLVFPSESSIPKLLEQQLLLPLDHSKLKGLDTLTPELMNSPVDPGNQYSIPYFWGTIGIMVNTDYIDASTITSWKSLWQPTLKQNLLLLDGNRETLGIALQSLGYSQNSKNKTELQEAAKALEELAPNVRAVLMEEVKTLMLVEEASVGIGYSGDAAFVMEENPSIVYVLPEDGGAVWTDNFAIPTVAKNIQGAYDFINFMLIPEHAAQNAEYVGYATPSDAAKKLLPAELTEDPTFYPSAEAIKKMEHYEYLGPDWVDYYNTLFLTFKLGL